MAMIAKAPFQSAQLLLDMLGGAIDAGARVHGIAVPLNFDSRSDVYRTFGSELPAFLGNDDARFDRLGKIFLDPPAQPFLHMGPQRVVTVEVLCFD